MNPEPSVVFLEPFWRMSKVWWMSAGAGGCRRELMKRTLAGILIQRGESLGESVIGSGKLTHPAP
jgi:hypothetical protein